MTDMRKSLPAESGAHIGSQGTDVRLLQNYLATYGYLESTVLANYNVPRTLAQPLPDKFGVFDEKTEKALRRFQEFHNLKVTGTLDSETLELMKRPRCGFPDIAEYVLHGNKWNKFDLRFSFQDFTNDLTQNEIRDAINMAFDYWADVTPLTFTEVDDDQNPDIRIRFATSEHGDGSPFDGSGGTLAHAFYPPPNGGDLAGDMHFDDDETWTVDVPPTGFDLVTVAAHEIGHALGLAHSTERDALMYPYYSPHRFLAEDDISGIQTLYPQPIENFWLDPLLLFGYKAA